MSRPSARVRLQPFDEADFEAWVAQAVPAYAHDHVLQGTWSAAEALERSLEAHRALLPQGLATPGHAFLRIVGPDDEAGVGYLWWAETEAAGTRGAYVYGLGVEPEARGRGFATAALEQLERLAGERGLGFVELHVFGHNDPARRLYESVGFRPTSITLRKPLR